MASGSSRRDVSGFCCIACWTIAIKSSILIVWNLVPISCSHTMFNAENPYCCVYCANNSASLRSSVRSLFWVSQDIKTLAEAAKSPSLISVPDTLTWHLSNVVINIQTSSLIVLSVKRQRTSEAPSNGNAGSPSGRLSECFLPSCV